MRGADEQTGALFSYLSPEALVPPITLSGQSVCR